MPGLGGGADPGAGWGLGWYGGLGARGSETWAQALDRGLEAKVRESGVQCSGSHPGRLPIHPSSWTGLPGLVVENEDRAMTPGSHCMRRVLCHRTGLWARHRRLRPRIF